MTTDSQDATERHVRQAPENRSDRKLRVYLFGGLGGLNWGYDTAVISVALLFLREDLELTSWGEGWVVTALTIGAVIGALVGGRLSDAFGRKPVLFVTALLFALGPLGMALAPDAISLIFFRFVAGLGAGLAAVIVPVYLAEVSPHKIRGKVTSLYALAVVVGQFLGFLAGWALSFSEAWRWMFGLGVLPALAFAVGVFFLWETPRWLITKGRHVEATASLGADRPPEEVEQEINEINMVLEAEAASGLRGARVFREPWVLRVLFIGIGLAAISMLMGINTIIYYTPTTLQSVGFTTEAAVTANLLVGVTNIIAIWFTLYFVDRWGRKPILIAGGIGTGVSLAVLAVVNLLMPSTEGSMVSGLVTLACIIVYIFMFQMSWAAVVTVLLGEIFPLGIRAAAMGLATAAMWGASGVVSFVFPPLLEAIGVGGLFAGFAVICLLGSLFTAIFVPETKQRTLEQIEMAMRSRSSASIG